MLSTYAGFPVLKFPNFLLGVLQNPVCLCHYLLKDILA